VGLRKEIAEGVRKRGDATCEWPKINRRRLKPMSFRGRDGWPMISYKTVETWPAPYPNPGLQSPDAIQLRVAELEDAVKRKGNALKTAIRRRERTEETATAERAQAWGAAKLARVAQEEERRRGASLEERARDAETQVLLVLVHQEVLTHVSVVLRRKYVRNVKVGAATLSARVSLDRRYTLLWLTTKCTWYLGRMKIAHRSSWGQY